jgi:membrane-associated phospholipid phosphatase
MPSIAIVLVCIAVLWRRGARAAAGAWAAAFVAGNVVAAAAGALVARPHLYEPLPRSVAWVSAFETSFPGDDAVRVVLVAALVAAVVPRILPLAAVWAGASFVLLELAGFHTPSDLAGALLLGVCLVAAATWVAPRPKEGFA